MSESNEATRAKHRRYHARHRDQIVVRRRAAYRADPEPARRHAAKWRKAHPEAAARARRRYYVRHLAQTIAQVHGYYAAHRAQCIERSRRYYAAHREAVLQRRQFARQPRGGDTLAGRVAYVMEHPEQYVLDALGIELRRYQREPLMRILDSIENHRGDTFVILFPRQSGKDELLLDLVVYLADLYATERAGIVVVNPTFRPQTVTALERFDAALDANPLTHGGWRRNGGFMRLVGKAHVSFLSGDAHANVAGATASLLLAVNEAQDVSPQVYYRKFEPMAASTNATRILSGTAWTSQTLLAQEMRRAQKAEQDDGRRRVFTVDADEVRAAMPWYGRHVDAAVAAFGRNHPLIKTQYFNETLDEQMRMFNETRIALMDGPVPLPALSPPLDERAGSLQIKPLHAHTRPRSECVGLGEAGGGREGIGPHIYAFCIDVAGQDEDNRWSSSGADAARIATSSQRDSTALSIIQVDLSTLETLHAPTYRVVHREAWTGISHLTLFGQLKALAEGWHPQHIVIDATGVGEGLWSLLDRAFPARVIPVKFTQHTKSEIGWRFLSIIETGRFRAFQTQPEINGDVSKMNRDKQHCENDQDVISGNLRLSPVKNLSEMARLQYLMCQSEILPGPSKTLRWGVPDGTRGPDGALVHDDFVLADSLVVELDRLQWAVPAQPFIIPGRDPLKEMSHFTTDD